MTTTIRDEALAQGTLGQAAYGMMLTVFGVQVPRFPRLAAQAAPDEWLNEFFVAKNGGYVDAVTAAPDDAAATRLTHAWAKRWLVDRDRELPLGALRNRLEKRLERSDLFSRSAVAHYWFLSEADDDDRPVTPDQLREIAAGAEVQLTVAESGQIQIGREGQLEAMIRELLVAAGRLHVGQLTFICAERFPSVVASGDAFGGLDDDEWDEVERKSEASDLVSTLVSLQDSERTASEIFDALTARERLVLRNAGDPAAIADAVGVGRSSAYSLIKQARARVIELAGSAAQSERVRGALVDLLMDKEPNVPS